MRPTALARWWLALMLTAASASGAPHDVRLIQAVRQRDPAAVRALLDKHADVNGAEPDGTTALHWAAYDNDAATAALLVHAGANVNTANALGITPLKLAANNGNAVVAAELLDAGAHPNAVNGAGET